MRSSSSVPEEFVPVGVGRYLAEIKQSSEGVSDRAGKRKWSLVLEVTEQPDGMVDKDGEDVDYVGKTIKWDISLQKQALWKVMQTCQALGEDITNEDTEFDFDATDYVGRKCVMIVGQQDDSVYGLRSRVNRLDHSSAWEAVAA